jgi:bacillithiol biosynthesis cysteine-adding enzyme BshC
MTYNPAAMTSAPVGIEYGRFQKPPSRFFLDYLAGRGAAAGFFEGGWDLPALEAAAERALRRERPRQALADALVGQQKERGAPAAAAAAERLRDPRAVAIVTGQQAVLFGGPALVFYKAIAAIRTAAALEARRGAPVVPVFWVASDDHDFEEIRAVEVLEAQGALRTLRYAPAVDPSGRPAWGIELDASIEGLLGELESALPDSPGRPEMLQCLRECYRPGARLSDAFARLISSLFPSLVVLDPADPALKTLMTPVLRREIEERSASSTLLAKTGGQLEAAGYAEQVPVREGFLNAFVVEGGVRRALGLRDDEVEVRGTDRRLSIAEAVKWLEREPSAWSANALLRPVVQDALLPTAAYVGGPAEIAYHAQIGPAYAHFGVPRPALFPRPAATLVEPSQARALEAEGLDLPELQQDVEALLARIARDSNPAVEASFAAARQAIERELRAVEESLGAVDPTLRAAAESARGRALFQVEGLQEKATRALKKRDQARSDRLRRAREALFPGGEPQERRLLFAAWLARWGRSVLESVSDRLDPFATVHQVISL